MNIVVLAGGVSSERNVSLSSGSLICRALRERGHRAILVDSYLGMEDFSGPVEALFSEGREEAVFKVSTDVPDIEAVKASRKGKIKGYFGSGVIEACSFADAVFIALHGGEGEDGRVQAYFDLLGIRYTGTGPLGSAIAMDKDVSKRLMAASGIRVAASRTLELGGNYEEIINEIKLPCVVKPVNGGSSIGVTVVKEQEALLPALRECAKYDSRAIVEDYIAGRELTIAVLDGVALPPVEIIPSDGFYDYRNKYQPGAAREVCPAEIDDGTLGKISVLAVRVHTALRLGSYSRMEFICREDGELFCLEANTLPGMTPTSLLPQEAEAVGMSYGELCEKLVILSQKENKR